MADFEKGNYTTVWCKHKEKAVRRGDNKGEVYDVYVGQLDTGGGKMISIEVYADKVTPTDTKGGELFPIKVGKWKGNGRKKATNSKAW